MSQKLSVNGLKWVKDLSKFNELFIKSYNEESDVRNFFFWCSIAWKFKWSWYWFNDFTCKNENWKKKKRKNLITDLYGKTEYVIHIRNLKQALNHGD